MTSDNNDGWITASLREVVRINPPKPKYAELDDDAAVGFVPMAAVDEVSGAITALEERRLGEVRSKSYRTFATGDVLFAKITPCMENGKSAVVPNLPNGHGFGSTEFHVLRPNKGVDARYVWRFLRQPAYRAEAEAHMSGSVGQMRVPVDFLKNTKIKLPADEDAQRQAADHLEELDIGSRVARRHLERSEKLLTHFKGSLLASACSGRLTEDFRAAEDSDNDTWVLPYLRAGRRPLSPAEHADASGLTSESQIELLPPNWRLVRLNDVFDVATGATPRRSSSEYYSRGSIPWVSSGAVNAGLITEPTELITERAIRETNAKIFPAGTLLVAMYGEGQTRGRVAELGIVAATNQAVAAILFQEHTAELRDYLRIFLEDSYQRIRALSFGGVQMNLSLGVIKDTVVPLPPPAERSEIVDRVRKGLAAYKRARQHLMRTRRCIEKANDDAAAAVFRGEWAPTTALDELGA